jgi:putative salt-induced outer membrane protein YdiY
MYSQSIVNTEKALPTTNSKFAAVVDGTMTNNRGNLNVFDLASGLSLGVRIDTNNTIRLISGLTMLHRNGGVIKDIGYGQLRHNFTIGKNTQLFNFYQAQYNNNLIMDNRQLLGSGFRFDLSKTDSSKFHCIFQLGVMYEREVINRDKIPETEIYQTDFIRSATNVVLKWDKDNVHIVSITYYQVHMLNVKDYRVLNDTELLVDINKRLSVNFIFQYRFDSKPPSVLTPHDYMSSIGIRYKLKR